MVNREISQDSKVKIYWDDLPYNYSRDNKIKIRNSFANKYKISKNNIEVIYRPLKLNNNGELIKITNAGIDNIIDINYQRELVKEYLKLENKSVDLERLFILDDKVNNEFKLLNDIENNNIKWSLKWLTIDNFLCFGSDNKLPISKFKGLTIVNSVPQNMGGKCVRGNTNITIDYDVNAIVEKIGYLPNDIIKKLTISELNTIYEKYGNIDLKVKTPYGYKEIQWCGITEKNADVYRCELEDGKYVEGADYHKLKNENDEFTYLKNVNKGDLIQTIDGIIKVKEISLLEDKDTLYDIQVKDVHQYYTNGIVSHNTTMTIDAVQFLLHGKTTKTDKNEEIFNSFTDKNELIVKGMLSLSDGVDIVIERKMTRTAKKNDGWTVKNYLNYYSILPDGEEKLLNDEDAIKTTKKIKESIGSEKDFELLVLATENNLDDLIGLTSSESTKIFNRLIGLEPIEKKEEISRNMYNEFAKKKKSNLYDVITLETEITTHNNNIENYKNNLEELNQNLINVNEDIFKTNNEIEKLINSKEKLDVTISTLNPSKLETEIEDITKQGLDKKKMIETLTNELNVIGEVFFDEDKYHKLTNDKNSYEVEKMSINKDIEKHEETIKELIENGVCKTCKRKLDDVDNTEHIEEHKKSVETLKTNLSKIITNLIKVTEELKTLDEDKKNSDNKDKIELKIARLEVEIGGLRNDINSKKTDLKKYKLNLNIIENNKKIDSEISVLKTDNQVNDKTKTDLIEKIEKNKNEITKNETDILDKSKLVETIKKENEVEKIFKIYIELFGKKGISKLILRSVLPIINSELQRLLDDICDFEVEVLIDSKNDIQLLIKKDDNYKKLKSGSGFERTASSIALRCVLGKISTLPMPNFITFDEVLGKVASENLEKIKELFDKIKDMYDIVFLISHNDLIKDWSDNIITVVKDNNVSKLKINGV